MSLLGLKRYVGAPPEEALRDVRSVHDMWLLTVDLVALEPGTSLGSGQLIEAGQEIEVRIRDRVEQSDRCVDVIRNLPEGLHEGREPRGL